MFRLKIGHWRLYLANFRLKKMNPAGIKRNNHVYANAVAAFKSRRYKLNGGTCDLCGRKLNRDDVQVHHVLPFYEFPQHGTNPANMEIACEDCHHAIHLNPYTNLHRMEQKARELGFDLQTHFTGKEAKQ